MHITHISMLTLYRPKAIEFQQADTEVVPIDGVKFRVVSAGYHHNVAIDSGNIATTINSTIIV